jgi:hypothetical protein
VQRSKIVETMLNLYNYKEEPKMYNISTFASFKVDRKDGMSDAAMIPKHHMKF